MNPVHQCNPQTTPPSQANRKQQELEEQRKAAAWEKENFNRKITIIKANEQKAVQGDPKPSTLTKTMFCPQVNVISSR